jgi:hypothetical protein
MVTVKCTATLARRLPFDFPDQLSPTSTILPAWCAHTFNLGRTPFVIITNEQSLFSSLLVFTPIKTVWPRFLVSLRRLLMDINAPKDIVQHELNEMQQVQFTRRPSRQTLGSMNDFIFQARGYLDSHPNASLDKVSFALNQIPCAPLKYEYPQDRVLEYLAAAAKSRQSFFPPRELKYMKGGLYEPE